MNKYKKLISVILLILIALTFGACGQERVPQSVEGFQSLMTEAGYELYDATLTTDTGSKANSVLLALDENYTIEYYNFIDDATAEYSFNSNKEIFENENTTKVMVKELSFNDYDYYSYSSTDNFYMVSRINNTMLYCVADKEYREDIVEVAEMLGYK